MYHAIPLYFVVAHNKNDTSTYCIKFVREESKVRGGEKIKEVAFQKGG